jgi:sporulation protein YlmC with PRC-barrel domain
MSAARVIPADLGRPVSHLAVADGVPVFDRDGRRIGVVDEVMADPVSGIFEGLVVHTTPLPGRHVYADHTQIAELRERGVLLAVDGGELHALAPAARGARRRGDAPESPLERRLRHALDWLNGVS